jgi:beta-glucanase (GH16 family)
MRKWLLGALVCTVFAGACSSESNESAGAGAANGGAANGGAANGGASNGGAANGGAANGGAANGGAANGGASNGGAANGGAANGGAANGGTSTGGTSTGGAGSGGGNSTGGVSCSSATAGYRVVWNDEFEGPSGSAVDAAKWTHDVGGNGWGNSELEYYTDGASNAALDGNGNLVITAKKQSMGGMNYTSARIKTQGLYSFTYGRVESRMKIPSGQGLWPAFWMLGNDIATNNWPACGEIDIMENIGKEPDIIHATIHGPGYSAGQGPTNQYSLPAPVASAFHVFAIEWEQSEIRWYVDGTLYSTKTTANIPSGAKWVYSHPFFIILNVAVGGGWPGSPDSTTTFPQQMVVDYVRVCQK